MSGLGTRRGVLTAGGHAVHRVAPSMLQPGGNDPDRPRVDTTPIVEQYQLVAAAMHRTSIAPCGNRYLWGCTCGTYGLTPPGSSAKASLVAQQHVLDQADVMFAHLEKPPEEMGQDE